jgi:hypothetical protein
MYYAGNHYVPLVTIYPQAKLREAVRNRLGM